jgi:hypothetical protein
VFLFSLPAVMARTLIAIKAANHTMSFETRSKKTVFADLTQKLRELPLRHPDRTILTRMIQDLGHELGKSPDATETPPLGQVSN